MVLAVRGATLIEENSRQAVCTATIELIERLLDKNRIKIGRIVSIIFSSTSDLTAYNPATAVRKKPQLNDVPLFCTAEPVISGAPQRVIRVLLTYRKLFGLKKPHPVYINGAGETLRPDLPSG